MTDAAPEEAAQICAELNTYMERRLQFHTRSLYVALGGLALLMVIAVALKMLLSNPALSPFLRLIARSLSILVLAVMPTTFIPYFWYMATTLRRTIKPRIERLRELKVVSASGTLLQLLRLTEGSTKKAVEQALLELVPFWDEAQFSAFTSQERRYIRHCIVPYTGDKIPPRNQGGWQDPRTFVTCSPLRAALCRKLAWFGNQEDLATLKETRLFTHPFFWDREVRDAAKEASKLLEARLAQKSRPDTLLRASSAPTAQPDELLRAASASSAPSTEELLHPSQQTDSPRE